MKIAILGLWHLGCVTAACCARHFQVTGLEPDAARLASLQTGRPPLHEPGLEALMAEGLQAGRLRFTADAGEACRDADVLWVCIDTPVDSNDQADTASVLNEVRRTIPQAIPECLILISSQLPVGTVRQLESEFPQRRFACSPENLRLGRAIEVFTHPDRVVAGCRDEVSRSRLAALFAPFGAEVIWMSPESAEMTKHAINSFLALSIAFMNEIAGLCEATGADAREVERGLRTDSRIAPKAYLSAGSAFAGGTLARDVVACSNVARQHGRPAELISAIRRSNEQHRQWPLDTLNRLLPEPARHQIAILGLTYKPGTNTLRRSAAIELASALHAQGNIVCTFDPSRPDIPSDLAFLNSAPDAYAATAGADAIVVGTEWPEFRQLDWSRILHGMKSPRVLDPGRFLEKSVAGFPGLKYVSVGSPS